MEKCRGRGEVASQGFLEPKNPENCMEPASLVTFTCTHSHSTAHANLHIGHSGQHSSILFPFTNTHTHKPKPTLRLTLRDPTVITG